ncbi:SOS response-associated peptidase family protein [Maribacter sp. MMG018]|uniref:SOS response-associated peptidase family protein n=1 Tax=Maribacter sp. MMG018 TaxID=2822688 RepID=UPI001B36D9AB|nr:SOS response-associated peptidase family protein [Maribacter sp. MMG018]MBQ4915956.1 SOS response-associated peptidase family protein [Maribacter sp. MMG018]
MYFKLSNTATKEILEKFTKATFKYPNLYTPQQVINGLNEVSIPIITMQEKDSISLSIWGLLPTKYSEDWGVFQRICNTLNLHENTLDSDLWCTKPIKQQRGLLPVTGFFTSFIKNGKSFPYHISLKNEKPFYLASVYNTLEDGFITCSLLIGKSAGFIKQYQNTVDNVPIIIGEEDVDSWLAHETPFDQVKNILKRRPVIDFKATPIAKELFNNDISYDSMLAAYEYPEI